MKRFVGCLAVLVLLASCQGPTVSLGGGADQLTVKVLVQGTNNGAASGRLLLPTAMTLNVTLSKDGVVKFQSSAPISSASSVSVGFNKVPYDDYVLSAEATDASGKVLFSGSANFTVNQGAYSTSLSLIPMVGDSSSSVTPNPVPTPMIKVDSFGGSVAAHGFRTWAVQNPNQRPMYWSVSNPSLSVYAQDSGGTPLVPTGTTVSAPASNSIYVTVYNSTNGLLSFSGSTDYGDLRLGSVADARFNTGYTLDGLEMNGILIDPVNNIFNPGPLPKLNNTSYFGPTGTVKKTVSVTNGANTSGSITLAYLSQFDVFFVGWLDDANLNAFTAAELQAMKDWVSSGGKIIIDGEDNQHQAVANAFGYSIVMGSSGTYPNSVAYGVGLSHPIFNGPFGDVSSAAILTSGNVGIVTPPAGATALAHASNGAGGFTDTVFVQSYGSGTVIFIVDIDMISSRVTGGGSLGGNNDVFTLNLFAFAGQ